MSEQLAIQLTEGFRYGVFHNSEEVARFKNENKAFEFAKSQKRNGYEVYDYLEDTTRQVILVPDFTEIRKLFRLLRELKAFWHGAINMDAVAHFEAAIFKVNAAEDIMSPKEALEVRSHASRAVHLVECDELPNVLDASVRLLRLVLIEATAPDGDLLAPFERRAKNTEALTSKILATLKIPNSDKAIVSLYEEYFLV